MFSVREARPPKWCKEIPQVTARKPWRILVVDDDPDILTICRVGLERVSGCEVETVTSGREALERAQAFHPDVILLDVMMPEMDGVATAERLRQSGTMRDVPVVFLTAKSPAYRSEGSLLRGAAGVIKKPFDPMTLGDALREILHAAGLRA